MSLSPCPARPTRHPRISNCISDYNPTTTTMLAFATSSTVSLHPPQRLTSCKRVHRTYRTTARLISLPTGLNIEVIDLPQYPSQSAQSSQPSIQSSVTSSKPPMLFVHGSLHAAWCFHLFQPFFAEKGYQTFAVSLRGAGLSQSGEKETSITIEQHISDLNALMGVLNLPQPPIIVGHSIGGFVIQKWVEQGTFNPSKMVLLASAPPSGLSKMSFRIIFKLGIWKFVTITLGFVRKLCATDVNVCREMFFSPKDVPGFSEEIEGDQVLRTYMPLLQLTKKTLDRKSLRVPVKDIGTLYGKVLVTGGELDCLVDDKGVEETAHHWGTQPYIFPNAPHDLILYSRWKDVAQYINDWLSESLQSELQFSASRNARID